jgi:hypothetical protein
MKPRIPLLALLALGAISALGFAQVPVPFISQPLVPDSATPGSAQFTLTLSGTGFVSGSVVDWNGAPLTTTFVNGTQVTAIVPAVHVALANTAWLTVVNPGPGATSNTAFFTTTVATSGVQFSRTDITTGGETETLATGDFNGDGKLDLAVSTHQKGTAILLGNGDGTFGSPTYNTVGSAPSSVVTGDFNRDGIVDLAVQNQNSSSVSILLGKGDGTFQAAKSVAIDGSFGRLGAGDFNGDGKLDLAATNGLDGTISVLLGNGDGSFQTHVDYAVGPGPIPMTVGDVNGDGILDLVAANDIHASTFEVLLGNGDGTFQAAVTHPTIGDPESLVLADFNGDGQLDLAILSEGGNPGIAILPGNGDGTFGTPMTYSAQCGNSLDDCTAAAADINGDGKLDLIVRNSPANTVQVLLGNGDGTFQTPVSFDTGGDPEQVVVGDFNGDGRLDLAVANFSTNSISVLMQQTPGPAVTLSPTVLNFGDQLVRSASPFQRVTLTNSGTEALDISSVAASTGFEQATTCGATLSAGKHCLINVDFFPGGVGRKTGALTITDNATGGTQTVALSGVATVLALSTTALNFGSQAVGTTSAPLTVTLTNHSAVRAVAINKVLIKGGNFLSFAQTNTCGSSVAAGARCTFSVTFDPKNAGQRDSILYIWDEGGATPQTVTLSGNGS